MTKIFIRAFGKGTGAVGEAVSERAAKAEQLFTDALSEVGYEVSAGKVVGVRDDEDDGIRFSIMKTESGERYVQIDANDIDLTSGKSIAAVIASLLKSKFNNVIIVNSQKIRVNAQTNREFRNSNWAKALRQEKPEWYNDKLKSIANADEIIRAAKNWCNENIKHERTDGITSFGRAKVLYKVGENGYEADVLVGLKEDGSALLYDLIDIESKKIVDATDGGEGMASLSSDSASTVDNNTIGKEKSQEVYNEILRKAKKNFTKTNAFAEAVRRSGLDFDDAVMVETRVEAEAESRQAAQYRAERSGTAAQTGVDKAALRNYVGKKTVANAVGRVVRAMKDMNTIIGEGFTETEIASLTKAAEEGLSESLWIDVNNAHSSREMERAVDRVVESALQQSRLRMIARHAGDHHAGAP